MKWFAFLILATSAFALVECSVAPNQSAIADRRTAYLERRINARDYSEFLSARYASLTNDPHQAAKFYAQTARSNPADRDLLERAVFTALISGRFDLAKDVASKARKETLSAASLPRIVLGVEALKAGKYNKVRQTLLSETSSLFNDTIARSLIAWSMLGKEGADAALQTLETTATGDKLLDGLSYSTRAFIQLNVGDDAGALETFETMWQANVRLASATEHYARLLVADGQRDKAARILRHFSNSVGQNAAIERLRTDLKNGVPIAIFRPTLLQGAALSIYTPAAALATQTSNDLAGVYFALALELDPGLDAARTLWGDALDNADRRKEAIVILTGVPENSVFYATSRGQIAWAQRRNEDNEAALQTARAALAAAPDRNLKIQLGDLFRSMDQQNEAERIFTEIIEADAKNDIDDWRIFYARGTARAQLDRWETAKVDLMRANTIAPNQPALLNFLGYSMVDRGENLNDSFEMIQRAAALRPNSGAIIDSLGWAHFKLGNFEEAVTHLERAVELAPSEATINDHLGDAYWRVGRRLEAGFQWNRSLRLAPQSKEAPLIKAKIERGLDRAKALNSASRETD